jgi:hypothetical protein
MCLVNDAVYIAKYASKEKCESLYGYIPGDNKKHPKEWTATGTQFAVPYVFKKLFSKEEILFEDMCETKSVTSALYLDMDESIPLRDREDSYLFSVVKQVRAIIASGNKEIYERVSQKDANTCNAWHHLSDEEVDARIAKGHNYRFIGKVGQFCPIKEGCGGGVLYREKDGKYYAATGSKGYRWVESEKVRTLGKEQDIDLSYYDNLAKDAAKALWQYGSIDWFTSDEEYSPENNGIFPF